MSDSPKDSKGCPDAPTDSKQSSDSSTDLMDETSDHCLDSTDVLEQASSLANPDAQPSASSNDASTLASSVAQPSASSNDASSLASSVAQPSASSNDASSLASSDAQLCASSMDCSTSEIVKTTPSILSRVLKGELSFLIEVPNIPPAGSAENTESSDCSENVTEDTSSSDSRLPGNMDTVASVTPAEFPKDSGAMSSSVCGGQPSGINQPSTEYECESDKSLEVSEIHSGDTSESLKKTVKSEKDKFVQRKTSIPSEDNTSESAESNLVEISTKLSRKDVEEASNVSSKSSEPDLLSPSTSSSDISSGYFSPKSRKNTLPVYYTENPPQITVSDNENKAPDSKVTQTCATPENLQSCPSKTLDTNEKLLEADPSCERSRKISPQSSRIMKEAAKNYSRSPGSDEDKKLKKRSRLDSSGKDTEEPFESALCNRMIDDFKTECAKVDSTLRMNTELEDLNAEKALEDKGEEFPERILNKTITVYQNLVKAKAFLQLKYSGVIHLSVAENVHQFGCRFDARDSNSVSSLNIESELIRHIPKPQSDLQTLVCVYWIMVYFLSRHTLLILSLFKSADDTNTQLVSYLALLKGISKFLSKLLKEPNIQSNSISESDYVSFSVLNSTLIDNIERLERLINNFLSHKS